MLGTRATALRMSGTTCTGINARRGDDAIVIEARNTLLADGGFQGNADLVRRFISPQPERLTQRSAGTSHGDALLMAEAAGAKLTDAEAFYGHLLSRDAMTKPSLWPYPTMDTLVGGAIMVDRYGRRFLDEGLGGIALSNAMARMDDPLKGTAIFDQTIWETAGRAEIVPANPTLVEAGGTLITAPDLATLATMISVPADVLIETVATYNVAISGDTGAQLSPPRTMGRMFGESRSSKTRVSLLPIAQPPYHAIPLSVGLTYTMGGIAIDEHARVIGRRNDKPMPGLYAAGSCTGGVEGGPLGGYIGGYLKAVGLGLIAGDGIGQNAQS
jgi:fumarate reductase flavoprotein subunit